MKVKVTGGFFQKTISIGISEFSSDTQNFWESVKYADVALYKAKERGRNRVTRFTADMWAPEEYYATQIEHRSSDKRIDPVRNGISNGVDRAKGGCIKYDNWSFSLRGRRPTSLPRGHRRAIGN